MVSVPRPSCCPSSRAHHVAAPVETCVVWTHQFSNASRLAKPAASNVAARMHPALMCSCLRIGLGLGLGLGLGGTGLGSGSGFGLRSFCFFFFAMLDATRYRLVLLVAAKFGAELAASEKSLRRCTIVRDKTSRLLLSCAVLAGLLLSFSCSCCSRLLIC